MPFWQLYYHVVWSTKDRQPLICREIEDQVREAIKISAARHGVTVHAIGGTDDHIHLVIELPPTATLSEVIGKVKGTSSYTINSELGDQLEYTFHWQRAYGVVSFAAAQLGAICRYVTHQRELHKKRQLKSMLEMSQADESRAVRRRATSPL